LSFLEGLVRNISSRGGFRAHPDLRLDLDRIWVKLANPGSLLPFYWNFQVDLIEPAGIHPESTPFLPSPNSKFLYFLGCLWFYTLLVNKKQNITEIYQALAKVLEQPPAGPDSPFSSPGNSVPVFLPENIFWDPGARKPARKWDPLWEKSLGLGLALLRSSLGSNPSWQEEDFLNRLGSLRQEVRESLFASEPVESKHEIPFENEALVKILSGILQKWQKKPAPKEGDLTETMIIPSGKTERPVPSGDESIETVVLSTRGEGRRDSAKEDLEKTVILSREGLNREPAKSNPQNISIENTTLTVVISPHDADPSGSFSQFSRKNLGALRENDPVTGGKRREKPREEQEGDFLSQTVILKAKTTKERKEPKD
ncbi:MAG: hypothetical protein H6Q42_1085, partial [Deltaproteobacteria bacterium]|nr:hypothetical protein [Deltaproteobacteria bacterium]